MDFDVQIRDSENKRLVSNHLCQGYVANRILTLQNCEIKCYISLVNAGGLEKMILKDMNCLQFKCVNVSCTSGRGNPTKVTEIELENLPELTNIEHDGYTVAIISKSYLPSLKRLNINQRTIYDFTIPHYVELGIYDYNNLLIKTNLYKHKLICGLEFGFRNYRNRLFAAKDRLRRLILASKIKKYWFSFFYSQKRDGINRFCLLSQR